MADEQERFERIVKRIRKEFEPEKIMLFGSRARGDYLKESDYDLLVVSKKFEGYDFRERIVKIYGLIDEPLNIDILCLTPKEFKERREELCIFRRAYEEGIEV